MTARYDWMPSSLLFIWRILYSFLCMLTLYSVSKPEQKEAYTHMVFKNLGNPQQCGQKTQLPYINQNGLRLYNSFPCEKTLAMLNTIHMLAFVNLITVARPVGPQSHCRVTGVTGLPRHLVLLDRFPSRRSVFAHVDRDYWQSGCSGDHRGLYPRQQRR